MIKCEICDKECKDVRMLSQHLSIYHKEISKENYYRQYMMSSNDGICPVCGKSTTFLNLSSGYRKHCSKSCGTLDVEVQNRKNNTLLDKYGTTNIYENKDIRENAVKKRKQTTLDRFGVENIFQLPSIREKAQNNSHTEDAINKQKQTCLDRYGVENQFQRDSVRQKMTENNYSQLHTLKRKQTCLKKYGVESIFQLKHVRKLTVSKESIHKIVETKRKNGTFNTSKPENDVYSGLIDMFGITDVKRNYKSDVYPFLCDFYIISLDLYIECNFSWTHGGHWYDNDDISIWKNKSTNSAYYSNAINIWTVRDVNKRNNAKTNKLNYVVFWTYQDFLTWKSLEFPIGHDWEREYTWLPNRKLSNHININKLSDGCQSCSNLAKQMQFQEFFKRELALWSDNSFEKYGTVQSNLYNNRLRYINKNPLELTDLEILRGLNISGKIRAYTTFDNTGMKIFLDKYKPTSIYDPCAGWGERLITCAYRNIEYFGIDINPEVVNGHRKIVSKFNLNRQFTVCTDSSKCTSNKYDTTFTCPPYWNTEIYTKNGAENLSYDSFLEWWKNVIINSNSTLFAYQINQKYKTDMNNVLLECGYQFIEEIVVRNKSSHFTRRNSKNIKTEYESIQVFKKS